MPRIGSIEIREAAQSGGAFQVTDPPDDQSWVGEWEERSEIELADGWRVSLRKDTNCIVVGSEEKYASDEVFDKALDAATRGLDIYSLLTDYHEQTVDAHNDYIVWFVDEEGQRRIREFGTHTLKSRGRARAKIDGEYPEPTIPEWHESFRFYRLSMITEDLFDAYRNQFLAVEHVLSDIRPPEPDEGENEWMLRALEEAHNRYDLSNYAPNESNPVESIHGVQYEYVRCGMFHSKSTSSRLQPRNKEDYETVREALTDLTKIYSKIVQERYGRSPNSPGGMSTYAFENSLQWMKDGNAKIVLREEKQNFESDQPFEFADNVDVVDAGFSHEQSRDGMMFVEATISVPDVSSTEIRQIDLVKQDDGETIPMISGAVANVLDISGFDVFECVMGIRLAIAWRMKFE